MPATRYQGAHRGYYVTVTPRPFTDGVHSSNEIVSVPQPNGGGGQPVTAGHWYRAKPTHKVNPKPRLDVKPTGGKVAHQPAGNPPRKRGSQRTAKSHNVQADLKAWRTGGLEF